MQSCALCVSFYLTGLFVLGAGNGQWLAEAVSLGHLGLRLRHQEQTWYIKNSDPQSAYVQHILHNHHEYGPIDKTMTLLKPLSNTSLLIPYEEHYIHSLHKEGKLIFEQSPDNINPLLLLAIDPSQPNKPVG